LGIWKKNKIPISDWDFGKPISIKLVSENPTIGVILCKEENRTVVEFTLPEDNKQIFSKEYKAVLPSKEALKKQLE
jgi:hypothetical protein